VAVLAAAGWLRTPAVPYLAVCTAATAAAVALATGRRRIGAQATAIALVTFCALAALGQLALHRIEDAWDDTAAAIMRGSAATMHHELGGLADELGRAAAAALDVPERPDAAFARLADLVAGDGDRGVVLYRDQRPVAWAGTVRAPVDSSGAPFTVVRTPFYITLQATARRGGDRAVATALLHAEPPADRLSQPLDQVIADRTGVDGFVLTPPWAGLPTDEASGASTFAPGGVPLVTVRPVPPQAGETSQRVKEQARSRCALALALALIAFLAAEWRGRGAHQGHRVVGLVVPLAALAVVPLNAFSNGSRLFDPTYFFSPVGGPYTASVGALGVTGAIALLAGLAATRARVRVRPRALAAALALAVSAGVPFAVAYVAGGITPPGAAVPLTLWIGWQIALALGATALLIVAAAAARGALSPRGGVPAVIAVALAVGAAALGPLLWQVPGGWPAWYAVLWCAAAVAAAFARASRLGVATAGAVAALGSAVIVWGTTAEKRVILAERDLAGLQVPDADAVTYLERFGDEIVVEGPPTDRADLLARYARSALADAAYPVRLSVWSAAGRPRVTLDLARFDTDTEAIATAVAAARRRDTTVLTQVVGSPGVQLVLAVPATDGTVTTVVVAPQTRLIPESPDAPLLGLSADPGTPPPYTISMLEVVPRRRGGADTVGAADTATGPAAGAAGRAAAALETPSVAGRPAAVPVRWTREGSELHGDWTVPSASGPGRAHVEVELRPYDALVQRAVLLVVLDLLAISLLSALSAVGDGVVGRWVRGHVRRWARSYRTRLTIVLFGFFVAPAVVFAAWSYRRLRSDDAEERALLVWQTLRAAATQGLDTLASDADRVGTPLLLYENGTLRAGSDTLYEQLAPLGLFLRPNIELALALGDEIRASRAERLAGGRVLFGYRAIDAPGGQRVVLAAPARSDEAGLDTRRGDLGILVLFTTVCGAVAALALSGLAARQFARPIDALRRAALAAAAGDREPELAGDPPIEFAPVFAAFRRMAADFGQSQRVLAWGEMARQIAHEIKNPLTPIRLGVQHLKRARAAGRPDFDQILEQNADRILSEIDRLDQIARAFSRYGSPPAEHTSAEPLDISPVVGDVVELERLGAGGGVVWELAGADEPIRALARADELREVLLNVLENARLAHARRVRVRVVADRGAVTWSPADDIGRDGPGRVTITIDDDGEGIPPEVLPRVFEPHFSTRTSGSGLGLALSRRIVDVWGGTIGVASERGRGTRVTIVLLLSVA
jgi:signal transduction histidine kinase